MKVALVHDWLGSRVGGAEQVFFELAEHFPDADLFALTFDKQVYAPYIGLRKVRTSFLNRMPGFIKHRPSFMLPMMRRAVEGMDFRGYDLVISNSTAWVKNIKVPEGTKHLSYCHSPARMLWDSWPKYLDTQHVGPFKLGPVGRFVVTHWASRLRLWDFYATKNIDVLVGNSHYITGRILKYYGRKASVLYPPVHLLETDGVDAKRDNYYLVLSSLSRYKNIDLVIEVFKASARKLIIAGDGPDRERLESLADGAPNIHFEGRVEDKRKSELMAKARGFIFPGVEDFGITPIEAMSLGTPVIALRAGGLKETVSDGVSGHFFDKPHPEALRVALDEFESKRWDPAKIKSTTTQYTKEAFEENLDGFVEKAMGTNE